MTPLLYRQGSAQLYGAECRLSVQPATLPGLLWDNSLAVVYGFNREPAYRNKGTGGEYLPLIPPLKWTSSIAQTVKPVTGYVASLAPKIEMEYAAAQNRYLGLNGTETSTPGFFLWNAGIVLEIRLPETQTLQLQLQVNNLFDKAFQSHLNRLKYFEYYAASPGGRRGIYNMGRNVGMKLVVPF